MKKLKYPRVLILCDRFDDCTGMGVTLTNLFGDWPRECVALAGYSIDKALCESIRPCAGYFAIDGQFVDIASRPKKTRKDASFLRKTAKLIYTKLGISDFSNIKLSSELKAFVDSFQPDIIFSALGDLKRVRFSESIKKHYPSAKLALYIVDDWPDSRYCGRWFESLWRWKYNKAVKGVIDKSDIRLSICQKMSDVYMTRYGAKFVPFHNPVDLEKWGNIERSPCYDDSVISIVYVGKINRDTEQQLIKLAAYVERLNVNEYRIKFDIYTPSPIPPRLQEFKNTEVKGSVANTAIPSLLKSYSLLFLTLGFSSETRNYVKLSMPTKLTEYLASGTPIILYAPKDIALTEYLSENSAAFTCTDEKELETTVLKVINNREAKDFVVDNAKKLVCRHDLKIIRENFRKAINQEI